MKLGRASFGVTSASSMTSMPFFRSPACVKCACPVNTTAIGNWRANASPGHAPERRAACPPLSAEQVRGTPAATAPQRRGTQRSRTHHDECGRRQNIPQVGALQPRARVSHALSDAKTEGPQRTSGKSMERDTTTRAGVWPPSCRVVRRGLSRRSVLPPTMTASDRARSRYTRCRATGPVQQRHG